MTRYFLNSDETKQDLKREIELYINDKEYYTVSEQLQAEYYICRLFMHICTTELLSGKNHEDVKKLIGINNFNLCYELYCQSMKYGTMV